MKMYDSFSIFNFQFSIMMKENIPEHVAIIMDGNGRWAKQRGLERWEGHKEGVETVRRVIDAAGHAGIKYLTLYAFSMENWNRPKEEVDVLMGLMVDAIVAETDNLMKEGIRVRAIGNLTDLPEKVRQKLNGLIEKTASNHNLTVVIALSYGARWEILNAAKQLMKDCQSGKVEDIESVTEMDFSGYLTTAGIPDPDLLIRTSGECRLSNFLLWQLAYTELYFLDKFWPDFEKEDLYLAVRNFQKRERRFGMTGEQLKK